MRENEEEKNKKGFLYHYCSKTKHSHKKEERVCRKRNKKVNYFILETLQKNILSREN